MAQGGDDSVGREPPSQPFIRSYEALTTPLPRINSGDRLSLPVTPPPEPDPDVEPPRNGFHIGNVSLRIAYTVVAALIAVVAVITSFRVFADDRLDTPTSVPQARAGGTLSPTPSPSPTVRLPKVPMNKPMTVHAGTGTYVASYVVDQKSGITYAQYGAPWKKSDMVSFAAVQRSGTVRTARALIASRPLPGVAPKRMTTYADYRRLAVKAVRFTLRYQPPQGKVRWTASQPLRNGMGWLLGYRYSYVYGGERHYAQAIVMVVGTGRAKPAMLFATVPDTQAERFRDLNMLYWTVRPV